MEILLRKNKYNIINNNNIKYKTKTDLIQECIDFNH